jgi:hypothetical protein
MLHVVYGVYRWWAKRVTFAMIIVWLAGKSGERCRCERLRWDIFIGFRSCRGDFGSGGNARYAGAIRNVNTKTRRGFKSAGLFILLLFSAVSWAMPVEPDFVAGHWTIRIATPMGAVLTLVHFLRTKKEPSLKALLATVPRAADTVCPFCGTQMLMLGSQCSCPMCGVVWS